MNDIWGEKKKNCQRTPRQVKLKKKKKLWWWVFWEISTILPLPMSAKLLVFMVTDWEPFLLSLLYICEISMTPYQTAICWTSYYGQFKKINWSSVALQCCVSFCGTAKWVSYPHTYVPFFRFPSQSSEDCSLWQKWVESLKKHFSKEDQETYEMCSTSLIIRKM